MSEPETGVREPGEVLGLLGDRLRGAFAAGEAESQRRALRLRHLPVPVVVALVLLALGSTALATRSVWAPLEPALRARDREPSHPAVWVLGGGHGGSAWRLSARACRGGAALALFVAGGGAGQLCDSAERGPLTFFDARGARTLVAVVVPSSAALVEVSVLGPAWRAGAYRPSSPAMLSAVPSAAPAGLARRAGLSPLVRYVGVAFSGERSLRAVRALDANGRVVLACDADGRCSR